MKTAHQTEKSTASAPADVLKEIARTYRKSQRKSLLRDIWASVKEARPYRFWQRILTYVRRVRMISFAVRILGYLFAILQTGTLFLLTTAIFFIILPILTAIASVLLLTAFLDMRKSRKRMEREIGERRVYVFFNLGTFGAETAAEFAKGEDRICLSVSPYWLTAEGHRGNRFYLNVRREDEHFFLIRRYFFFHIRKKLLKSDQTVLVY